MPLLSLLRRPLVWLLVAEVAIVGCLGVVAASVVSSRLSSVAGAVRSSGLAEMPVVAGLGGEASPVPLSPPTPHGIGPTPGLAMSSGFLGGQLRTINRDGSAWERAEWTIAQAVLAFARAYLDEVVLPGVRAASGR